MKVLAYAVIGLGSLACPIAAQAQKLDMETVNKADLSANGEKGVSPVYLKAQVLLDRARFSPGVIDGRMGGNTKIAIKDFEREHDLKDDGELDKELWSKLTESASAPILTEYTITKDDVKGPFVEVPEKFEEMAELKQLAYTSSAELLAEKFHMDIDLLKALNSDKQLDKAGETIIVANVEAEQEDDRSAKVAKIVVLKKESILRALDKDGKPIAVYPATVGSEEKPAPSGTYEVRAVAMNPNYTYNPEKYKFEGVKADKPFQIAPGPNNPVGTVWIDLTKETYGIHGTPEPSKVGKTYSHGCIRLTNWDAMELAKMVEKGTPVEFQD